MSLQRVSLGRIGVLRTVKLRPCRTHFVSRLAQTPFSRHLTHSAATHSPATSTAATTTIGQQLRDEWASYNNFPSASSAEAFQEGQTVTVHGFLSRKRVKSSKLVFVDIQIDNAPSIQIVSTYEDANSPAHLASKALRAIPLHSPVAVTGTVAKIHGDPSAVLSSTPREPGTFPKGVFRIDIDLQSIQPLNVFPKDIIVSDGVQFPPTDRHMQIRFSDPLRTRLLIRPQIGAQLRKSLDNLGFTEVETPILFKSTPEGAREFLVPTRRPGYAYALPQSPQQYKQTLMASGVRAYYQFARCFRDEDLRADRQPEFTQLDLEMSFATGKDVMRTVETIMTSLLSSLKDRYSFIKNGDDTYPVPRDSLKPTDIENPALNCFEANPEFSRITYNDAMSRFGIDKPDLRIPFEISRVDHLLTSSFISMISDHEKPAVDAFRFRPNLGDEGDLTPTFAFVDEFLKTLPTPLAQNKDGAPVALIVNSKKPLNGLSPLGFEGVEGLTSHEAFSDLEDGDVIVFQAREDKPFHGGSTALGTIRNLLYHGAVSKGLFPRDFSFKFLWVTDFPMFTPNTDTDPGQGGSAGFSATHHPFTAPLTDNDVELLATDPLSARADHYDLVLNGVELGGGSRRIHMAKMQEYVMKEILKMTPEGMKQFSHLLKALRAGCPPHAGFALGFDRLVAVLTHTDSIRDVTAFPKSMKGEDLMVNSPGKITTQELLTYHLAFAKTDKK
ncbi:tRNA synthetases class II-domain-containing protein [Podospora fimiseda]|uniref:tRNA synthetases class II-domain-containing protein n=1 Tax=Podospora fimiseda TaxID=252190 RepID=A0AAN7BXD8_9PEZI|nr:tRNA synthetases class II-domain-containing protein [Podospora fimiseda]